MTVRNNEIQIILLYYVYPQVSLLSKKTMAMEIDDVDVNGNNTNKTNNIIELIEYNIIINVWHLFWVQFSPLV